MNAVTAPGNVAGRFQPIVQTYPHPDGQRCGVELDASCTEIGVRDRIALMIATALPGVDVGPGDGANSHLVILVGKYYTGTLVDLNRVALNQKLAMVEPDPVVCLERTGPLLWILGFRGLEVYGDHVRALASIDGIEAVTPLNGDHRGRAVTLYVPSLGVRSDDDAAASAGLLAQIREKFNFHFAPVLGAKPADMPAPA